MSVDKFAESSHFTDFVNLKTITIAAFSALLFLISIIGISNYGGVLFTEKYFKKYVYENIRQSSDLAKAQDLIWKIRSQISYFELNDDRSKLKLRKNSDELAAKLSRVVGNYRGQPLKEIEQIRAEEFVAHLNQYLDNRDLFFELIDRGEIKKALLHRDATIVPMGLAVHDKLDEIIAINRAQAEKELTVFIGLRQNALFIILMMFSAVILLTLLIYRYLTRVQARLQNVINRSTGDLKRSLDLICSQQKELSDLFDFAPCGYHSLDKDGIFTRVNQTELGWLGYKRDELVGKKRFFDILTADSSDIVRANFDTLMHSGELKNVECRLVRKDATVCTVSLTASVVYGIDGGVAEIRSTLNDISEIKRTEAFASAILNSVPAEIAVVDKKGVIISVNDPWRRFSVENSDVPGSPAPSTSVGVDYCSVCTNSDGLASVGEGAEDVRRGIEDVIEGRLPIFNIEYPCHSESEQRWFSMSVTPLGGDMGGAVISHTNITQRKLAEIRVRESEAMWAAILEALPLAVFGKDIRKNFQWNLWNLQAEKLFGVKAKDCIGKYDSDFFPKEEADFFRAKDIEASQSFGIIDIPEEPAQTPNGPVTLHTRKIVVRDENGDPKILLGITEDISEKLKVQKALNTALEMRELLHSMDQAIAVSSSKQSLVDNVLKYALSCKRWDVATYWELDNEGSVSKALAVQSKDNNSCIDFVKATQEIVLQHDVGLPGRVVNSRAVSWIASFESDSNFPRKIYALKNGLNGGLAFPVFKEGSVVGVFELVSKGVLESFEFLNDDFLAIGARIGQAFEKFEMIKVLEIERAKSLQSAKLASLGEMSAGIAHEINNPLAIIASSVGLISKFRDDPEKVESKIHAIQKSCDRISRIVSGLKKFSRSGEKGVYARHSLCDIAREVTTLTEAKSKRHSTPVVVECATDAQILCDDVEIEQVLVNLINNGIDAVKGRADRWVRILIFEDGATIVLRVMDSGPRIMESIRTKLFEPFFTTKNVGEGTGLGLSIAKGILDEHKATIAVLSDLPNTCFEIRFPKVDTNKLAA